jgi:hypothetical protein
MLLGILIDGLVDIDYSPNQCIQPQKKSLLRYAPLSLYCSNDVHHRQLQYVPDD